MFERIETTVETLLGNAELATSPVEAAPERALVFEVIGPVDTFIKAARAAGLEWLGEEIGSDPEDDEAEDDENDEPVPERGDTPLYVTMPSLAGLQKVLSYWKRYAAGEPRPKDAARDWWSLFAYLRDLRTWSAKDRIDPNLDRYVQRVLRDSPDRPVRLELDLWFRADPELRAQARGYVDALMRVVDGQVLDFATIEPIHYQAALIELPAAQARVLSGFEGPLASADRVMRVRPQSMYTASPTEESPNVATKPPLPQSLPAGEPFAALLDGYPVTDHEHLGGRVAVLEVDVSADDAPVARRFHGTAMASLIVRGDLGSLQSPLDRPIVALPILAAPQGLADECTPPDKLPIGLVYRAILALVEGADGNKPIGRRIVLINHSICDREAPFARRASPWAKLLDYLSHAYDLLFVVSAGNVHAPFDLDTYEDCSDFEDADPVARQIVLLRAVERAKGGRTILSPAESINALTVAAIHSDQSEGCPDGFIDPFDAVGIANLGSTVGFGVNRGLKPDIAEHGGRQLVRTATSDGVVSAWAIEHPDVGQLAAIPDPTGLVSNRLGRITGTSNAAALTTRSGIRLGEALETLYAGEGEDWAASRTRAVALKALLAHSSRWGDAGDLLEAVHGPDWRRWRGAAGRFLGYGRPDLDRVLTAEGSRITLLADDVIRHNVRHEYKVPIPRAMIGNRELRRVTLTLAWSTPIDPVSQTYRGVRLELVDPQGKRKFWKGVKAIAQPDVHAGRRGTLQHMVLEGGQKLPLGPDGAFSVCVQAYAQLQPYAELDVPYALAVTIELAQTVRQDLHVDVRTRVRAKTQIRAPIPTRVRV